MADLAKIEAALRAADAAGNVEDARRLAQAYAEARRAQGQTLAPSRTLGNAPPPPSLDEINARNREMAAPSAGERIGRELGLGARSMLRGGLGTLGIVTDPLARMVGLPSAREGADAMSDRLGLPEPQTASERVGGGITEALTGGGGIMGLGRMLATRAPGIGQAAGEFLSAQPVSQLAAMVGGSGAQGVTRESGGSQGAQALAGLAGGIGTPLGIATGQAGLRGLVRGGAAGREAMQQGIRDFRSLGVSPSVGQAAGNRRTQGLESLLAGAPTSSGRMATFAEKQAEGIGQGLQRRADDFFPNASGERAGRAIERGADTFANNTRVMRQALYWTADQYIPANTQLPLTRTWQALDALVSPTPGATATTGALVNPKIAQMAENVAQDLAANGGSMPYEAVRALRSRIGEELADFSLSPDRPTAQYKRLYAALSQDLEDAARRQGPAAEQAFKRANNYTRASAERLEQVQRVVDKNGGPEKVFNAVMSGTRDGGTTLRAVMQSLPEEGQKAVTAAVIKRMGLPTPGQAGLADAQFSAQTFLTNWNRVSPEARRALFDRHGAQFSRDMDKIARVAERIRDGSKVFANPSGTANRSGAYLYYGGLAGGAGSAALGGPAGPLAYLVIGGLAGNAGARLLTNPNVVSWLARATELPVSALPQQINVLKQMDDPGAQELAARLEEQRPN